MALDKIFKFFNLDADYDDEDYGYEEYEEAPEVLSNRRTSKPQHFDEPEEEPKAKSGFLGSKPKVVSMNNKSMEVKVVKPHSFEDSQDICDMLISNRPVIVNLEGFDPTEAQQIMDFVCGCIYAIRGKYHQISKYIFIFTPNSVDISGDSLGLENGISSMPVLNREF